MGSRENLTESISRELGSFVSSKSSTFACGGSIPVEPPDGDVSTVNAPWCPPLTLRWDSSGHPRETSSLHFPAQKGDDWTNEKLAKLARDCQPATFGRSGEDVFDETYRKATKLDRGDFSIDFCPYELGIIDTIAQVLLPNAGGKYGTHGVKAELYKLNIYEAPSGFFKTHVDTPRAETQFGSLVVSLPCYHEGGQLVVSHAGHSKTFDWEASEANPNSEDSIQWAAFYSDCEHEVLEVTKGHRITLTYNLYFALGRDDLAGNSPAMDVKSLPLYQKIKSAIDEPSFMNDGGYLGIYCQHAYAHSTNEGAKALPSILKGSDMAVYSIFVALGLETTVRPVLEHDERWFEDEELDEMDESEDESISATNIFDRAFVRDDLTEVVTSYEGGYDGDSYRDIIESFHGREMRVNWLTHLKKQNRNIGMVHLTYGNEAGIGYMYTSAALIVKVPAAEERLKAKEDPTEETEEEPTEVAKEDPTD